MIFMSFSNPFFFVCCYFSLLKRDWLSSEGSDLLWQLQERHGLEVLFDDRVHNHLEDHLDVGGVGGRGEVVVDEFAGRGVERDKGGGDEAGGRVHVAVCTWRRGDRGNNQTLQWYKYGSTENWKSAPLRCASGQCGIPTREIVILQGKNVFTVARQWFSDT